MRGLRSAAVALAFVALAGGRARAGEVVEPWPDGTTPHKRYEVDEAGRRQGRYLEYREDGKTVAIDAGYRNDVLEGSYLESFPSGRPSIRTSYRAGKRHGHFESFSPEGDPLEVATYVDGALDGKRSVWRNKKLVAAQTWKSGALATLEGAVAFPRTTEEVTRTVEKILGGELPQAAAPVKGKTRPTARAPVPSPASPAASAALAAAPKDLDALRTEALRRLRAYRYVCGIPWEDVVAPDGPTLSAQYASLVCARLGELTHEPSNPGLPDDVFQRCAKGASECNLHQGREMTGRSAVDGWMDDSDPSNIDRVGHRRWALSLALRETGFGFSDGSKDRFCAMYAMDHSRAERTDLPFVPFPARGWTPVDLFSAHHAWSVAIDPVAALRLDVANAKIRVTRLSNDFVPADADLEIERVSFLPDGAIGGRPVLIFRPKAIDVSVGAAYLAELTSVDPKSHKPTVFLRWVVGFSTGTSASSPPEGEDSEK